MPSFPGRNSRVRKPRIEFKAVFGSCKIFSENAIFGKGKCIQAVWLPWNSFYGKSISVFGSFKQFTENAFCFTENQFPCLVCGSFYGKYEMLYKFKHLHYLDKPVTVQN